MIENTGTSVPEASLGPLEARAILRLGLAVGHERDRHGPPSLRLGLLSQLESRLEGRIDVRPRPWAPGSARRRAQGAVSAPSATTASPGPSANGMSTLTSPSVGWMSDAAARAGVERLLEARDHAVLALAVHRAGVVHHPDGVRGLLERGLVEGERLPDHLARGERDRLQHARVVHDAPVGRETPPAPRGRPRAGSCRRGRSGAPRAPWRASPRRSASACWKARNASSTAAS